ncbi:MAG: hypothetical protein FVQ84_09145 [Planctomycetes bacterium]|nr:hypothetical protein [Planctomycetota bacterium]
MNENLIKAREKLPDKVAGRKHALHALGDKRTELEQMCWLMFVRTDEIDKAIKLAKTAVFLEKTDNEKVRASIDKLDKEVVQLRLDVNEQIRKGLHTQKMNRAITDKTADIVSKRAYLSFAPERLLPLDNAVRDAELARTEAVRNSQLSPEILGVYRKRYCEASVAMYTAYCDARIAIGTIAQDGFAVLGEGEITEAVNAADFVNENHKTIEEDSDFLWGKDRISNVWDEIVHGLAGDRVRAKQLNEIDYPIPLKEIDMVDDEGIPMLNQPCNMILPDSEDNYPDSKLNKARIQVERKKPRHGVPAGELAPYNN